MTSVGTAGTEPTGSGVPWGSIDGVILDMDGVLWRGETPLPGLADLFRALHESALPFVLATNNSARHLGDYVRRLASFGAHVAQDRILTSAIAAVADVARCHGVGSAVFVIGEAGLSDALTSAGFRVSNEPSAEIAAVVVGFDRGLTYSKLRDAAVLLHRGADYVATNADPSFPVEDAVHPGAGATVAALEAVTGRNPRVVGKPEAPLFELAAERLGASPERILVVGDRLDTDIAGANRFGARSVLLTTGIDSLQSAALSPWRPDGVLAGLPELTVRLRPAMASHFSKP